MRYSGKWFSVAMVVVGIGIGGFLLVRRDAAHAGAAAQFPSGGSVASRQPPVAAPAMPPQAGVTPPPAPMLVPAAEAAPLFVVGGTPPTPTGIALEPVGHPGYEPLPEYAELPQYEELPAYGELPGADAAVETLRVTGTSNEPELSEELLATAVFTSESGLALNGPNGPNGTVAPVRYLYDAPGGAISPNAATLPDAPIPTWMINPSVAPIVSSVPASEAVPMALAMADSPTAASRSASPTGAKMAGVEMTGAETAWTGTVGANPSNETLPPSPPQPTLPLPPPAGGVASANTDAALPGSGGAFGNIPEEIGPRSIAPVDNVAPTPTPTVVERRVLSSQQGASVLVETVGNPRISVGKEATFEIVVRNPGNIQAGGLLVTAACPSELEVRSVTADLGAARSQPGSCEWTLPKLDPYGSATMTIVGVPRTAKPFTIPVRVTLPAVEDVAMFEVLEPKMAVSIEGPPKLLADRSEVFRLVLQNSGTGEAEDVRIVLSTLADGQDREVTVPHDIGTISPGEPMQLDMRMTARRPGPLRVRVAAVNDLLGTLAEATTTVDVCKPELSVAVEGPGIQYVGGCVNYRFTLRNTGTATAENVAVVATLPETARWMTEKPDVALAARSHQMTWSLPNLEPGEEQTCIIGVESLRPGECVARVEASADGNLRTTAQLPGNVEAVATLVMDVAEPGRPVFLENDATYTLTLTNPGSAEALNVEVLGEFGTGVHEIAADGAKYRTQANRIQFEPIASIAPGSSVTLTIRTKSRNSGSSVWRFQATASGDGLQVARQGTTRFYGENGTSPKTPAPPTGTTPPTAAVTPSRFGSPDATLRASLNGAANGTAGGSNSTASVGTRGAARPPVPLSGAAAPVEVIGSVPPPASGRASEMVPIPPLRASEESGVPAGGASVDSAEEKQPSTEHRFLG